MPPKEVKEPEKKPEPCRVCGGTIFTYETPVNTNRLSFVHVRLKCEQCGEWCGGYTLKNKNKED